MKKASKWLHPEQDFSGSAASQFPAPSDAQLSVLQGNRTELSRLDSLLRPNTLSSLAAEVMSDDAGLVSRLHMERDKSSGSSLANLSSRPTRDNLHEWVFFSAAWSIMLKGVPLWASKPAAAQTDVLQWHYVQLKQKYVSLLELGDGRVVSRGEDGSARQRPMSIWMWSSLAAFHHLSPSQRATVARTMLGDFKKLSLNPTCIHRKKMTTPE